MRVTLCRVPAGILGISPNLAPRKHEARIRPHTGLSLHSSLIAFVTFLPCPLRPRRLSYRQAGISYRRCRCEPAGAKSQARSQRRTRNADDWNDQRRVCRGYSRRRDFRRGRTVIWRDRSEWDGSGRSDRSEISRSRGILCGPKSKNVDYHSLTSASRRLGSLAPEAGRSARRRNHGAI